MRLLAEAQGPALRLDRARRRHDALPRRVRVRVAEEDDVARSERGPAREELAVGEDERAAVAAVPPRFGGPAREVEELAVLALVAGRAVDEEELVLEGDLEGAALARALLRIRRAGFVGQPTVLPADVPTRIRGLDLGIVQAHERLRAHLSQIDAQPPNVLGQDCDRRHVVASTRVPVLAVNMKQLSVFERLGHFDPEVRRVDRGIDRGPVESHFSGQVAPRVAEQVEDRRPVDAVDTWRRITIPPVPGTFLHVQRDLVHLPFLGISHCLVDRPRFADGDVVVCAPVKDVRGRPGEVRNEIERARGAVGVLPALRERALRPSAVRVEADPSGARCDRREAIRIVYGEVPGTVAAHRVAGQANVVGLHVGDGEPLAERLVGVEPPPVLPIEAERAAIRGSDDPEVGFG